MNYNIWLSEYLYFCFLNQKKGALWIPTESYVLTMTQNVPWSWCVQTRSDRLLHPETISVGCTFNTQLNPNWTTWIKVLPSLPVCSFPSRLKTNNNNKRIDPTGSVSDPNTKCKTAMWQCGCRSWLPNSGGADTHIYTQTHRQGRVGGMGLGGNLRLVRWGWVEGRRDSVGGIPKGQI